MDIHAPEKPIHSFKEFAIHIAVVTVGILIALGLDGVRESLREHRLVRETRADFREELQVNVDHMHDEIPRVAAGSEALKVLAAEAPALAGEHSDQVAARLESVRNPYYFLSTNSWQAALSTGALAHMGTEEVSLYAWSAQATKTYADLQGKAMEAETAAIAFWKAHPHPTPADTTEGEERILRFARAEQFLAYVGPQTESGYRNALEIASH